MDELHIGKIIGQRAATLFGSPALIAPGHRSVTYHDLFSQITTFAINLRGHGINRNDVVAVVLSEGPDFATCILAVSSAAVCAPLNPQLPQAEFEFLLRDMKAKAVVLSAFSSPAAFETAQKMTLPMLMIESLKQDTASVHASHGGAQNQNAQSCFTDADDTALLLYTSGTTAAPKGVALSHRSVCISAASMAETLALGQDDACLGIMPLFHVHGVVGTMLAPLLSGGAVILPGRFHAPRFFDQMAVAKPTWFTGTPAILHQISERAADNRETIRQSRLRFIRSASAALPGDLMASLERQFRVPVIEAYGMTEASHQVASNPLPPGPRKRGSVGLPGVPQVVIHGPDGRELQRGKSGEIVIRGPTVISHYQAERLVNAEAFRGGWLRTGDQGFLDEDGYLFIQGRLKEIINRGGEKVSPLAVEAILNRHPAVAESGVFSIPDVRLGEEIAACVILKNGRDVTIRELQKFVSEHLVDHKIPRHIVFAETLPKSATGKLQRSVLQARWSERTVQVHAAKQQPRYVPTNSETEKLLGSIWAEVLTIDDIGSEHNFFDLGGDSLQAIMILARITAQFGIELPVTTMFDCPTIAGLAREIDDLAASRDCDVALIERTDYSNDLRALSFTQELIAEFSRDPLLVRSTALNRIAALRISGSLDRGALQKALNGIVERHEVLRTNLALSEKGAFAVVHNQGPLQLIDIDLGNIDPVKQAEQMRAAAIEFGNRRYDMTRDRLVRFGLIRVSDAERWLLVCSHYFVFDGWSMRLFIQELAKLYRAAIENAAPDLESLPIQYADYSQWQADRLNAGALDKQMSYWRGLLAEEPPPIKFDRKKWISAENRFELDRHVILLDANITQSLRNIASRHRATLNMVLLTALNIVFARLDGHNDVLILTQSAGRSRRETESLIGNFVHILPIRSKVRAGWTFLQQLAALRQISLEAMANEVVPLSSMIKEIFPGRNLLLNPISPLLFVFKNYSMPTTTACGTTFTPTDLDYFTEPFGLIVKVHDGKPELPCNFLYNRCVVSDEQVRRIAICYRLVLEQISSDPNTPVEKFLPLSVLVRKLGLRVVLAEALRSLLDKISWLR